MRHFAKQLIACETKGNDSSETTASVAFPVPEKLRLSLMVLVGTSGFRALISRALALAAVEVRWLRAVQVRTDGAFEGVEALHEQMDPAEFIEGRIVVLAQLLGLLVAFIGGNMTSRLVREIWPQISLGGLDFGKGGKYEKAR
jgi:hypothetical protein